MGFNISFFIAGVALVLTYNTAHCQSLQFNQVVTFDGTTSGSGNGFNDGALYTCPDGKLWKIESLNFYKSSNNNSNGGYMTYKINGSALGVSPYTGNAPMVVNVSFPIWLKPGDNIRASYNSQGSPTGIPMTYFISILEFNAP